MSWLNNISLKAKIGLIIGIAVAGLCLFGWITHTTLEKVKVGGKLYAEIIDDKEAVADILPPPAHILMIDWYYR